MARISKRDLAMIYQTFLRIVKDADDYWSGGKGARSWRRLMVDYNVPINNPVTLYAYRGACHWVREYTLAFGKPPSITEFFQLGVYRANCIYKMWSKDPEVSLDWKDYVDLPLKEMEELVAMQGGSLDPKVIRAKIKKVKDRAATQVARLERMLP